MIRLRLTTAFCLLHELKSSTAPASWANQICARLRVMTGFGRPNAGLTFTMILEFGLHTHHSILVHFPPCLTTTTTQHHRRKLANIIPVAGASSGDIDTASLPIHTGHLWATTHPPLRSPPFAALNLRPPSQSLRQAFLAPTPALLLFFGARTRCEVRREGRTK